MLNELDILSQQIGRLVSLNDQYRHAQSHLMQQLAQMRVSLDEVQSALEQTRRERDALRSERATLAATIDEASACLRALLEKLPQPSAVAAETPARAEDYTYGEEA